MTAPGPAPGPPPAPPGLLRSRVLARVGVPHAFTTRQGGTSSGLFASLNFGNPGDLPAPDRDPPANIARNIARTLDALACPGREVVQVHQVHGAEAHTVRRQDPSTPQPTPGPTPDPRADALITDDPARILLIRVADCAPVLIASADGKLVAAVHAGWRGVIADVVASAVSALTALARENPGEFNPLDLGLVAAIGPCIGPEHFEVGPEVLEHFARAFPGEPVWWIDPASAHGKGRVDLKAALRLQLLRAGVSEVEVLPHCTAAGGELFFSHRRDLGRTGRMAALIGPAQVRRRPRLVARLDREPLPPGQRPPPPDDLGACPVTADDAPALAQLMIDAYRGTIDDEGETLDDARAEVARVLAGAYGPFDGYASELIRKGDAVVAATLITHFDGLPMVAFSMTHPAWRRRGLGRAGLLRAMRRLREQGHHAVHLAVTHGNAPAQALYASVGFA